MLPIGSYTNAITLTVAAMIYILRLHMWSTRSIRTNYSYANSLGNTVRVLCSDTYPLYAVEYED